MQLLAFIKEFIEREKQSPTYREMCQFLRTRNTQAAASHVDTLIKKGLLLRVADHSDRQLIPIEPEDSSHRPDPKDYPLPADMQAALASQDQLQEEPDEDVVSLRHRWSPKIEARTNQTMKQLTGGLFAWEGDRLVSLRREPTHPTLRDQRKHDGPQEQD